MTENATPEAEPDIAAIKRRRAVIIVTIALIAAVVGWNWGSIGDYWDGPKKPRYAGCYEGGGTVVRLSDQGFIHTPDGNWPYKVIGAKAGGNPATLAVNEIAAAPENGSLKFTRAPRGEGIRSPISRDKGFRIAGFAFEKAPCKGMERRPS